MKADRLSMSEEFLREAVLRSRAGQAAPFPLAIGALRAREAGTSASKNCGLGETADAPVDLSTQGREILDRFFPRDLDETELGYLRSFTADWVERQDALDRKRNHFLKDFRGRHGFDRSRYAPEVLAEFDAGLAKINAEEDAARRAAAERIASLRP